MREKHVKIWLFVWLAVCFLSACRLWTDPVQMPQCSEEPSVKMLQSSYELAAQMPQCSAESAVADQTDSVWEKGYHLPIPREERTEAEEDCRAAMEQIADIYRQAEKGGASNVTLADETLRKMQDRISDLGFPVTGSDPYSTMDHYEKMEQFLEACREGRSGSVILYEIHSSGGIGRMKLISDGDELYVLSAKAAWREDNTPVLAWISYDRIREWRLTQKGWFCYELCVPEPPEVSELVDGSQMIRVRPLDETCRALTKQCVRGLGYQGNNLLCCNWDAQNLEKLDYNGAFEALYSMKYGKPPEAAAYAEGIPAEEFERVILEYLPVNTEQLRRWAVFDETRQTYAWVGLGCLNYAPTFFATSLPEVTAVRENEDGSVTLTVDAVNEMLTCDDAVITHELTIRFREDGSFRYLGNCILEDGLQKIPDYQYRLR